MNLEVITPEKKIFKGIAVSVKVPGEKSPFQMLENHMSIISTLEKGNVSIVVGEIEYLDEEFRVDPDENILSFKINRGIVKNENNIVTILLD